MMLKIYFDDILIDEDSYTGLSNDFQLFTDSFKLGSTASNSFILSMDKSSVETHPTEVKIEDDDTTFYLLVDSIEEEKYVYNYTLTDKLVNFNFNYDASVIIDEKKELEETCYLSDIWKDMCNQAGVEYDDTYTFANDIEVSWYDNTIQARKYLSFIAQLQAGYATILENGKQSFKPYKRAFSKTIDIDECSDFILGEHKVISRVVYDTGTVFWAFGDATGTTIYLDTDNVFITSEEVVENIYNAIVGFEFYMVDVPTAPIDSSIRAGDIITFTDGVNDYPTIAQYTMDFFGGWTGGYSLQVKTDKQEETKITGEKEKIKKIETNINRIDATLKITAEETDENSSSIAELQIASNEITTTVSSLDNSVNGTEILDDNIINLSDDTATTSGMSITIEDNTITLDGTATDDILYDLNQELTLQASQYSVDGLLDEINLVIKDTEDNELYNGNNGNFELEEEKETTNVKIFIPSGTSYIERIFVPSLSKVINEGGILEKLNDIKEALNTINSTMMTQTSTAFEMLFTQTGIQDTVNTLQEILSGNTTSLETLRQYIRFEGASITLGKSDSQASLIVTNDRISFMNGSNESAYITGNQLYITDSTILNKMQIAQWETKPDEVGNLNTRYIGGT